MTGPVRFNEPEDRQTNPIMPRNQKKRIPKLNNRLEFEVDRQRQFIYDRGIEVLWEQSYICTCLSTMTKSPQINCPICHGRGIAYLPAEKKIVTLQSQDREVSNTDLGLLESGTATATTMPNSPISFRDRISVPKVSIRQSMLIKVTPKRVEEGFRLPYDVNRILLARTENGKSLELGKDYRLDLNENIFYPKEEYLGKNISINIDTILRYLVIDLLKESRYQYTNKGEETEEFVNLPKKLLLRREDAWVDPIPRSMEDDFPTEKEEGTWEDPKRNMSGGFFGGSISG